MQRYNEWVSEMKILIVDDLVIRHDRILLKLMEHNPDKYGGATWYNAYNAKSACEALQQHIFDEVWLDHDLGGNLPTGQVVAETIAALSEDRRPEGVAIHSMNPVGAKKMYNILQDAGVPSGLVAV